MGVLDNLNYLRRAALFPCAQPNPVLIIEAGAQALFPVLLQAVTFGCLDIIKMRAGISPWHARGMKGLIGGAIPPEQADFVNKVYRYAVPLEKALFFMFVVDLTTEFFARWQSNFFRLGGCDQVEDNCEAWGDSPGFINYPFLDWEPPIYHNTHQNGHCPFSLRSTFSVPHGWHYSASFSLKVEPIFHGEAATGVQTRIRKIAPNEFIFHEQNTPAPWFGNQIRAQYMLQGQSHQVSTTEFYTMEAKADVAVVGTTGSVNVSVSREPLRDNNFLPTSCLDAAQDSGIFQT